MSAGTEIQIIAILTAAACALPGVFLVLRNMAMLADAITHTILLGIVLGFFLTGDLSSPVLIIGAAAVGVLTVWLTEMVEKTKLVSGDAATGIVFPLLFSIAVILISKYGGAVHLDTDSVLLGELAFAPFDRMVVSGRDIGAKGIYTAGALLLINIGVISIFFKELKMATFDPVLASVLGFSPVLLHFGIMGLVSLTAVGAFQAVGSILVVAFMIGPPVTAYLLTDDLKIMLILSVLIGLIAGVGGYQIAAVFDISIAGSMALVIGLIFVLVFIGSPRYGLFTTIWKRRNQKISFAEYTFLLHLYHHRGTSSETDENGVASVSGHLNWSERYLRRIARRLIRRQLVLCSADCYELTAAGEAAGIQFEKNIFE